MVKNPPANAGDIRDTGSIPGSGRSPGGGHATHSSILAWRIPMDRGAWGYKESDMTEWLSIQQSTTQDTFHHNSDTKGQEFMRKLEAEHVSFPLRTPSRERLFGRECLRDTE